MCSGNCGGCKSKKSEKETLLWNTLKSLLDYEVYFYEGGLSARITVPAVIVHTALDIIRDNKPKE